MKDSVINKISSILEHDERPLTFQEATKYLDMSSSYLYKLTSTAKIPHYKPNNKKIYFKKTDLKDWLLQNKVSSKLEIAKRGK